MSVKVTTMVENTVPVGMGLIGEHGLSFHIKAGDRNILLDTGQGKALANNAGFLGINLKKTDTVVLSHGHFDHTGGLQTVMSAAGEFDLYAHPTLFDGKFTHRNEMYLPIGIPYPKEKIEEAGVKVHLTAEPVELAPGIMTTGEIKMTNDFEVIEKGLLAKDGGGYITDPLADDQGIIIESDKGLIVVLGCAHRGLINTLTKVRALKGASNIYAIIGGLHLFAADDVRIQKTIDELKEFNPEIIGASHCTGHRAMAAIMNEFTDRFIPAMVGTVIEA